MDLNELNKSELVELAQELDPNAHRGLRKQHLIRIIEGKETTPLPPYPVHEKRRKIALFVIKNWERVEALVTCPARAKKATSCFQCPDTQVGECWTSNHVVREKTT